MTEAPAFVDTNVFAYALDSADPSKQARAQELVEERRSEIAVSTQVLLELHAVCTSKLGMTREDARTAVESIADFPVTSTDRALVLKAADLAAGAELSIFDAAIVCAAQRAGCTVLLSEDLDPGQRFDGLVVENPFAS